MKSFLDPKNEGTVIGNSSYEKLIPSYIFKIDQVLLNIYPKDFSFIAEENLKIIFELFAKYNIKVNLMQNSAISFRVCVNGDKIKMPRLMNELNEHFNVSSENGLELITIRYYDADTIAKVLEGKVIIVEQRNSKTAQMVVRLV